MVFKRFDLLNIPISLSYKNEYFYTTYFGATLSMLCLIIIIGISSYEIKTLIDKSSFSIISNKYSDLNQIIDFSKIPLLFQLIDNAGEIIEINDKLYEFKAYDMEWLVENDKKGKKNYKVINTKLEIDYCDKVLNNSELKYLSSFNLSQYACIKSNQNITSYGYFGDLNNGFKGFRIYLNKCNGKNDCYNDSYIIQRLKNIKFTIAYLGLNINLLKMGGKNMDYQMFSKACSISTNLLKKFYFPFSIGRFISLENIFYKKKEVINYIIGNTPTMDTDLDPSSTIDNNRNTLAYFSFNFDGNIEEINKEVKGFFDTISIIGNAFNIILTIIKVINNYYSNKILFVDIFKSIFFNEDNKNINFNNYIQSPLNFSKNFNNKIIIFKKKNVMDLSDEIEINNNNIIKFNKNHQMSIDSDKSQSKRKISQLFINNHDDITSKKLFFFYLFPIWILKKNKSFNNVCLIKDRICNYFSVERLNELIKLKESLDIKTKKIKINQTEFTKNNNKYPDNNNSNEIQKNSKKS